MNMSASNVVSLPLPSRPAKPEAAELTPQTIKGLKPAAERIEIKDGKYPLYLLVYPTGKKSFQFRMKKDGKSLRETLGAVGSITLSQARQKALELKASGGAQAIEKRVAKAAPPSVGMTVSQAFAIYMGGEAGTIRTAKEKWRVFEKDAEPHIGARLLRDVTRRELADIIKAKADSGAPIAALALFKMLAAFFAWTVKGGWTDTDLDVNPMANVPRPARSAVRERALSEQELGWLFRAFPHAGEFAAPLEMVLRTGTRRSDIFDLCWQEVRNDYLDLDTTKNGFPFIVSLHPSTASLLPTRPAASVAADAVWTVNKTAYSKPMDRLRAEMAKLAAEEEVEAERWTLHDFRRTIRTYLESLLDDNFRQLVPPHISERILAHKDSTIAKHYNKHEYFAEKREALRIWNDYLDRIRDEALAR